MSNTGEMTPSSPKDHAPTWRRAFIALWPDAASRHALAIARPPTAPGVRPLHPLDLHLTLAFLGDLDRCQAEMLTHALRGHAPTAVDLQATRTALWPDSRRPKVHVLEFAITPLLSGLHQSVQDAVRAAALPVEDRPYRPHVTLARLGRAAALPSMATPATARFPRLALCHGVDAPAGEPRYRLIADWSAD